MGETRIKIASGEVENMLMHDYISSFATEVLISSGMSTIMDLKKCNQFYESKGIKTSVFQCTTTYPTPAQEVGLNVIDYLVSECKCPVGLSDHSGEIYPSMAAVTIGATKLEFHAVFNKSMFGPDASSSLDIEQIIELVKGVRFIETCLANPVNKRDAAKYSDLKNIFGKSLAVNKDLLKGHIISKEDLESKKPGNEGYSASRYYDLIGKKLNKNLGRNSFINNQDFE